MAEAIALEYAVADSSLSPEARPLLRGMLWLAILSGLCVVAAFYALSGTLLSLVLHLGVFTATIFIALRVGAEMRLLFPRSEDPGATTRLTLDLLALIGLTSIGLAPIGYQLIEQFRLYSTNQVGALLLGLAYALLAASTVRHLMLYRLLANSCRQINRFRMAKWLVALGWVKMIYEALWLGSCAAALVLIGARGALDSEDLAVFFAFAALFTTLGFSVVWIWMIVAHAQLLRLTRPSLWNRQLNLSSSPPVLR